MKRTALIVVLATACTSEPPAPGPAGVAPTPRGVAIGVVASVTGPDAAAHAAYLDGMRLALEEVGGDLRLEVRDRRGDAELTGDHITRLLDEGAAALVVVGDPQPLVDRRTRVQEAAVPVMLLGGDLYSRRALYREVFQMTPPLLWQARVLARYLVDDRGHDRIAIVLGERDPATQRSVARQALRDRGADADAILPLERALRSPPAADAIVFLGDAAEASRLAGASATSRLAFGVAGLAAGADALPPGTVAVGHYAWAGWAEPIPRVSRFRAAFRERFGRLPSGGAQDGYDAVRLLTDAGGMTVEALARTDADGYSALPVRFGPDDRTAAEEFPLGLFAVPQEREPWATDPPHWRPLMRTFTYDGRRTSVLDEDKRVFFPAWRRGRPSPPFHRSRHGIVTRSAEDPLH